jgi:hypothetical protein
MAREESFFDELARGLADGSVTRGKALRLMGAALVGGTLGSLGIGGEAEADPPGCKRNGKHCTRNNQCCSKNCSSGTCACQQNGGSCGNNSQCCSGNCVNGTCSACPVGTTPCGTQCCQTGETCNNDQCVVSAGCTADTSCGACIDPATGQPQPCFCATLEGGTGTFCFHSPFCASSCDECRSFPSAVCVQREVCRNISGFPFACGFPCRAGLPPQSCP